MPLSHLEFKDLRNEIEDSIGDKTAETVRNSSLKWFGGLFAIMGLGGWAFLNASFERKLDDVSRESRRQLDEQAQLLDAELREARFQLFQIEQSRENIQNIQSEVENIRSESRGVLTDIKQTTSQVGFLQEKYLVDVALLLHTRDKLIGQAAAIERRIGQWEKAGLQTASAATGKLELTPEQPADWGAKKIVILRERPGDAEDAVAAGRDADSDHDNGVRMLGLSSNLRVALARRGYEVEEWDVGLGVAEKEVKAILRTGAAVPRFDHNAPALFAHPDFDGTDGVVGELKQYLQKQHGLASMAAVTTDDFAPSETYRASFRELSAAEAEFEIGEIAVLYLPLETQVVR